jgi:hypothetical protein
MKRQDLMSLALLGLTAAGLVGGNTLSAEEATNGAPKAECACPAAACKPMTAEQQAFYGKLNDQGKQMFIKMDMEGRNMAMQTAKAAPGKNSCAGLNGCAAPGKNDCMGKGSCKGTSVKGFSDPNKAVQVTYDKMMAKRQGMQGM